MSVTFLASTRKGPGCSRKRAHFTNTAKMFSTNYNEFKGWQPAGFFLKIIFRQKRLVWIRLPSFSLCEEIGTKHILSKTLGKRQGWLFFLVLILLMLLSVHCLLYHCFIYCRFWVPPRPKKEAPHQPTGEMLPAPWTPPPPVPAIHAKSARRDFVTARAPGNH